ncbi:ABC transporter permease [Malacoplasma penetrans]|uniref:ABC transporter permease n=1 Tax=Malacoplasma penetrans TaxID=28227 RepID=UPI001010EFE1|nr:ABC transporter permease [Malacoplasma penetrans]RXY96867.1 ABC transporter permease [Malacoplasma penetrans]
MKTIIKAILKFFKFSKLTFIGLFVLIFFSLSIFTVLNSTSLNLTNSYSTVSNSGNLHDFVINENYRYGNGTYVLDTSNSNNGTTSSSPNGTVKIESISKATSNSGTGTSTYTYNISFKLEESLIAPSATYEWTFAYKSAFDKYKADSTTYADFGNNFVNYTATITSTDSDVDTSNWTNKTNFLSEATSLISNKSSALTIYVQNLYKNEYLETLQTETNVTVRDFKSVNISNTKQNIFFKLIEASPDYTIDKLVIYQGNNLSAATDFSAVDLVLNSTTTQLTNDASLSRGLLPFLYRAKWSNDSVTFDDIYNYSLANENYNPYTNQNNGTTVSDSKITSQSTNLKTIIDTSNGIINDNHQVRFSYSIAGVAPVSGYIEDFTSYGAIVSTNYLETLGKRPVNYQDWVSHLSDKQASFNAWLNSLSENTFEIDNQTFVILGTGITPDFMYPIVSFSNLVPDSNTEQVVYTNSSGYSKMINSFRGNDQETFLVGKFSTRNSNLNNQTLAQINSITTNYMAWPSNINAAYMYDDTSNTMSPTALRVIFIPQIVTTITSVSGFLTTFILILSIIIAVVIIKRCIETNRNSLGIMQANGYKKREIILGMCLLILIPVLAASVLGYILGISLQTVAINLLGSFWTLPTEISGISFASMFLTLFIVALLFLAIVIVFSSICLLGETSEFMKDDAKYKMTKVASALKKPFVKFSIIDRLRAAIAFSSLWRLILLSLMSALLVSSLTFSINILDSFKDSAEKTYGIRNYNYALNLLTPTLQSGQYYTVPYQQQGKTLNKTTYFDTSLATGTYDQSDNYISQRYWETGSAYNTDASSNTLFSDNLKKFGNYQLISQDDLNAQTSELYYLKNKTTTKAFADITLGAGSVSSNPWTLASQLMPTNNTSYANKAFNGMFGSAVADSTTPISIEGITETNLYQAIKKFTKAYAVLKDEADANATPIANGFGGGNPTVVLIDEINNNDSAFYDYIDSQSDPNYSYYLEFTTALMSGSNNGIVTKVSPGFLNLLYYIYSKTNLSEYTYSINYHKLVVEQQDSPFTYINFNIKNINSREVNNPDSLNITGISNDFTNPNLSITNEKNRVLNQTLWNESSYVDNQGNIVYPIVINEYAKRKYDLNVGNVITVDILNSADRYSRTYFGASNPVAYFKIIDIATTYQGAEFYINQYDANKILGLTINNVKPKVPTSLEEISNTVNWANLEYDYGNNTSNSSSTTITTPTSVANKDAFIGSESGFNGIFSTSETDLKEVTGGVSLYSLSGIYPGTDLISPDDTTSNKLFADSNNMKKAINQLGFLDLLDSSGNPTVNAKDLIQRIADIFGSSSSFFIVSSASSISSTLNVLNTSSSTLTKLQVSFLSILLIITVLIIVIVSSLIINDSFKLAAILKCLGLDDKKNAASFLSVYLPVFFFGLLISVPITFAMTSVYITFIFNFARILIVSNNSFWHFLAASLGIIVIFFLSYWTTWQKIRKMDLAQSIK